MDLESHILLSPLEEKFAFSNLLGFDILKDSDLETFKN